jgi:hypothetical protein
MQKAISRTQQAMLVAVALPVGFLAGYMAYQVAPELVHAVAPTVVRMVVGS